MTSIPSGFCSECHALESVEIPENISHIGEDAFLNCYRLKEIRIPSSVESISSEAFRYCRAMRDYYCLRREPPSLNNSNVFGEIPDNCMIWVNKSTDRTILTAYKTASNWSYYADHMAEMED